MLKYAHTFKHYVTNQIYRVTTKSNRVYIWFFNTCQLYLHHFLCCAVPLQWPKKYTFPYVYTKVRLLLKGVGKTDKGVSLVVGLSLICGWGVLGGDAWREEVISTSLRTFSCSCDILSARRAVRYKAEARKTVAKANTPAAQNNPSLILRQLGLGFDQFFKWPDSTLTPANSRISPTAKQILQHIAPV